MNTPKNENKTTEGIVRNALANLLVSIPSIKYGSVSVEFILHNNRIRKINYSTTEKRQEEIV